MAELWSRPFLPAALLLVVLGLCVWLPRRLVAAPGLALFRSLLPSWRFFEQIEPVPALHHRVAPGGEDWGDWQETLTVPERTASSLWLNAAGNLHFACQSLGEHLLAELGEAPALAEAEHELVSYHLVRVLVELRASAALRSSPALRYQFRLVGGEPEAAPLFVSRVHGPA
jgi:hypothetical protein